jgi:hypothetical protein
MQKIQNNIKNDLLYVYDVLYTSIKQDSMLFDKKLTCKLKYTPGQVREALGLDDELTIKNTPKQNTKKEERTQNITSINMLRNFYYEVLKAIYDYSLEEDKRTKVLNSISSDELKRLYSIISNVPITKSESKKGIVDKLRYFFDDEARTASLIKNKF